MEEDYYFLHEAPSSAYCSEALDVVALQEVGYTASDLALCSTEEARALIPFERADMLKVLPLALVRAGAAQKLHCVALTESPAKLREVRFATGYEAVLTAAPAPVFEEALYRAYFGSDARLRASFEKIAARGPHRPQLTLPPPQGDAACFVESLMQYAAVRGASDVHLVPSGDGCVVKLRVDGELLQHREHLYDTIFHDQIVNRLKVLASLDISTRLLPQDGAFVFPVAGGDRHIRISILPSIYGESVVLRFARESAVPLLSELGVEPMTLAVLREALSEGGGLFAFTGPTGSGKTTTMYSLAAELDRRGRNVVTVEDPVEKRLLGPVQIQVRTAQGFTFAKAIRSVLRHDPDVVLIGEMRDAESAQIGLEAASTGHLTLTSLHIASALQAVSRLETIGIPRRQGVEALSLVLNQRLLPKLCVKCRRRVEGIVQQRATAGSFESVGCRACSGSGYSGLVLITELLDLRSERAKEAMMEQAMPLALAERLSSAAYMSWEVALQYHLSRGHITKAQAEEFLRGDG